jgi:hypothetical protein
LQFVPATDLYRSYQPKSRQQKGCEHCELFTSILGYGFFDFSLESGSGVHVLQHLSKDPRKRT